MHWLNLCLPVLVLSPRTRGRPCKKQAETEVNRLNGRTCVCRFGHPADPSKKQAETEVNGRTCVCRFGHPADPSKKQADTEVDKLVNTRTPINLGVCLFLTGVREVTEPSDTSIPNLLQHPNTLRGYRKSRHKFGQSH